MRKIFQVPWVLPLALSIGLGEVLSPHQHRGQLRADDPIAI
jgi:hypothetical protein